MALFLHVASARVPADPEAIADPKRVMVDLAAHSRRTDIRLDMVPRQGSGRSEGPAYTSRLIEYVSDVRDGWRPHIAAASCDSLRRCLHCLDGLVEQGGL